ncbi:MAG: MFS transporter [Actinobacteria bacterium]|nr:MFS transporter [Actinomycetota bacterium]
MTLPAPLRSRPFRLLLIGQTVSSFGDWMGTFALMALVKELSGSDTAVGGILVLRLLPSGIAGPLAARLVSRWDRRSTMLAMDLARAGMMAAVPFVGAVWWVYIWAFTTELASLIFLPARDAAIPDLLDEEHLADANSFVLASSYGNIPIGGAAFALFSYLGGLDLPIWIDAGTFLVSYAFLAQLPSLQARDLDIEAEEVRFRDAFRLDVVRRIMPAATTVFVGVGALFTLGIPFVHEVMRASSVAFGFLVSLFGLGATVGLVAVHLTGQPTILRIRSGVVVLGGTLAAMSLTSLLWLAYIGAVSFGAAATYALVGAVTYLQTNLEGDDRTLGFAVFHVVLRIAMSLAAVGAGIAADALGPVTVLGVGTLHPAATVLFCSGLTVIAGATLLHLPSGREEPTSDDGDHHRHRVLDPSDPGT